MLFIISSMYNNKWLQSLERACRSSAQVSVVEIVQQTFCLSGGKAAFVCEDVEWVQ